ncbi:MAG: peptidase M14 [Lewinellaceae bacterium]|nr:peptidase M14 [Lewinellaceae bacterium]
MKKPAAILVLLLLFSCNSREQSPPQSPREGEESPPQSPQREGEGLNGAAELALDPLYGQLYDAYEQYREGTIDDRRFKHEDILPLLRRLKPPFEVSQAGQSIEGRSINLVRLGSGPRTVLLWSQMHGDEATATMALMDIFNFLGASDAFDAFRQAILSELTLYFIPMLNPDGAEKFQRRNALDIDLNRDALRLVTPEAQTLKRVRDQTQAQWGFNLHDQNAYYAAGNSANTASISFLAPAFNIEKDINDVRGNAMRLIVLLDRLLQQHIPGKVAKYDDTFEPRAFGDNIQKWGTSTILIESGGLKGDPEKQELRRLHFTMLLAAFDAIASGSYQAAQIQDYEKIPFNNSNAYHDLIIREAQVEKNGQWYTVDLGFRHTEAEYNDYRDHYHRASLADIGDLSTYHAYEQLDARGYQAVPGKTYPSAFPSLDALRRQDIPALLRQGYTTFQLTSLPHRSQWAELPLEAVTAGKAPANEIRLNGNPSLLLRKDGRFRYAVINGYLYDLGAGGGGR